MISIFSNCLFSHGHRIRTRTADGTLVLSCEDCGHCQPILTSEMLAGPQSKQEEIQGKPICKVKKSFRVAAPAAVGGSRFHRKS